MGLPWKWGRIDKAEVRNWLWGCFNCKRQAVERSLQKYILRSVAQAIVFLFYAVVGLSWSWLPLDPVIVILDWTITIPDSGYFHKKIYNNNLPFSNIYKQHLYFRFFRYNHLCSPDRSVNRLEVVGIVFPSCSETSYIFLKCQKSPYLELVSCKPCVFFR